MPLMQKPLQIASRILKLISEDKLDAKQLTTHQRRICVRFMLHEGKWTQSEIADILGVHRSQIVRDKCKIRKQDSWMLNEIDERQFATDLMRVAELASARLFRKGLEKYAWQVQRECLESLQSLGYLEKKPIEVKGHLTLLEVLNFANSNGNSQSGNNGSKDAINRASSSPLGITDN